jgi:hypothetical protein
MKGEAPVRVEGVEFTDYLLSKVSIYSPADAGKFLANNDDKKAKSGRLLAWLYKFGLLPNNPDSWASTLTRLLSSYESYVGKYGPANEIAVIEKQMEPIIPRDLGRSLHLFDTYCNEVGLSLSYFSPPALRFHRIFLIISRTSQNFTYLQGYDRFAYICAIVACTFAQALGLKADIAEALTFHLAEFITTKVAFSHLVLNTERAKRSFAELSELLEKGSPGTYSAFRSQQITPDIYALNWLLSLFSDQHPLSQLFLVWDLIFLHLEHRELYVNALCIAHLNQCQIGLTSAETLQRILKACNFDLKRLSSDADRIAGFTKIPTMPNEVRHGVKPGTVLLVIGAVSAVVLLLLRWQMK